MRQPFVSEMLFPDKGVFIGIKYYQTKEEGMKTVKALMMVLVSAFVVATLALPVWAFNPQPEPPGKQNSLQTNQPAQLKLQGSITKIQGNNLVLRDAAGKLHTIGILAGSPEDKARFGRLKIGGTVRIEGGRLFTPQQ